MYNFETIYKTCNVYVTTLTRSSTAIEFVERELQPNNTIDYTSVCVTTLTQSYTDMEFVEKQLQSNNIEYTFRIDYTV